MSRRLVVTAFSFLLVLALVLPAAAKPVKTSFRVFKNVTLAGTQLEPGEYKLVADESTVTIFQDGKKVLEAPANWVSGEKPRQTSIVTNGQAVSEIHIYGQERHLKFVN